MNHILLRLVAAALLAVACNTAQAGLEWSLSTNPVNGNNTAGNDLEVIFSVTATEPTLTAIRGGDYGENPDGAAPSCESLMSCDDLAQYSVNFSIDSQGEALGNSFDLQVSNLISGLIHLPGSNGSETSEMFMSQPTPSSYYFVYGTLGTPASLSTLFAATDTVDVLKLEIDIADFEDFVNVSDVDVSILPGEANSLTQTQFGEFGSLDAPENTNEVFFAYPTANAEAPGAGESVTQRYSAVPEPSSFAYLGLFTLCVTGISWYRRRTQA